MQEAQRKNTVRYLNTEVLDLYTAVIFECEKLIWIILRYKIIPKYSRKYRKIQKNKLRLHD